MTLARICWNSAYDACLLKVCAFSSSKSIILSIRRHSIAKTNQLSKISQVNDNFNWKQFLRAFGVDLSRPHFRTQHAQNVSRARMHYFSKFERVSLISFIYLTCQSLCTISAILLHYLIPVRNYVQDFDASLTRYRVFPYNYLPPNSYPQG